jgi:hypothetical protein
MAFLVLIITLFPVTGWACPSCAASNNGQFFNQKMMMMGVLWLLPVLVAGGIAVLVYRINQKERE